MGEKKMEMKEAATAEKTVPENVVKPTAKEYLELAQKTRQEELVNASHELERFLQHYSVELDFVVTETSDGNRIKRIIFKDLLL